MNDTTSLPWADPGAEIDLEQLRQALQRVLWAGRDAPRIQHLQLLKARRSTSRQRQPHPVTLWLEAQLQAAQGSGTQRLYGKAYRHGASLQALADAQRQATAAPAFGAPVSHVAELDMLLWAWPNDPVLTQLPVLLDPLRVRPHLPAVLRGSADAPQVEVLRYEPERRATLRVRCGDRVVYGKTFCDDRAALLQQRFQHFWHLSLLDDGAPTVAEPLGFDPVTRTLWQAPAQGRPLLDLAGDANGPRHLAAVGRALACLHQAPLAASSQRPLSHWVAELDRRCTKISRSAPSLAPRAQAVTERLRQAAGRLPPAPPSLIHGDCHPDQVWMDRDRVLLFDFDEFSLGHPMEDLAEFSVKLDQAPLPAPTRQQLQAALLHGYRERAPQRYCAAGLAWHRALQSLLQASRAFVFQRPGWAHDLQQHLARTEALAAEVDAEVVA